MTRRPPASVRASIGVLLALSWSCASDAPGSPGAALRAFLEAANEKRYQEVERGLASDARQFLTTAQAAESGGLKGYAASITKNHTVVKYRTLSVRITGVRALVDCEMRYRSGQPTVGPVAMVHEAGTWKVALYSEEDGAAWLQER